MKKVKFGIIGIGNMGTSHLKNILEGNCPELDVTAVCDIEESRLVAAKEMLAKAKETNPELSDFDTYTDATEMLKSGKIEAVLVAVPHYDHPRYVIEALQNNVHPMCEKPAGVYTEQVREMIAEAEKHPALVFGMMFNQRTNSIFKKMREIVQNGEIGIIRRTNWIITSWYRAQAYYDSGSWRATWSGEGGGVLLNQCPHNLDLWQWICGMPCKIDAKLHYGKWHDIEVEDDVTAYVEYPNGATGVFVTTTGDVPGSNRFEITGDRGKLVFEDGKLKLTKLEMSEPEFSKTNTVPFAWPEMETVDIDIVDTGKQHIDILNNFAAAILHGEALIAEGNEGINGLTISNAMHLSSWLGKPVELPFDEKLYKEELMKRVATSRRKEHVVSVVADTSATYNN